MAEKPYEWTGSATERLMLEMLNLEHLADPVETIPEATSVAASDEDCNWPVVIFHPKP